MREEVIEGFNQYSKGYRQKLVEAEEVIKKMPDFKKCSIDSTTDLANFKHKHVLYYFQLPNNFEFSTNEICKTILKEKEENKTLKLPKVNTLNTDNPNNNILYVGKSSGKFSTRLKQHLQSNSKSTYALHLNEWDRIFKPKKKIQLDLFYVSFSESINTSNKDLLEIIESSLHYKLNPILGRTGH